MNISNLGSISILAPPIVPSALDRNSVIVSEPVIPVLLSSLYIYPGYTGESKDTKITKDTKIPKSIIIGFKDPNVS